MVTQAPEERVRLGAGRNSSSLAVHWLGEPSHEVDLHRGVVYLEIGDARVGIPS